MRWVVKIRRPDATSPVCRKKPSRWLKEWVLELQHRRCLGCEVMLSKVEFDHVIPLGLGGSNTPENWAALCPTCHRTKTRNDLRSIAKAKRQRRYHETGRSRASRSSWTLGGKQEGGFDRSRRRHLNGIVVGKCDCPKCEEERG